MRRQQRQLTAGAMTLTLAIGVGAATLSLHSAAVGAQAVATAPPATQGVVREAVANLPGVNLFYLDSGGTGTPVVFLHAGTGSARVWEYQIPAFTQAGYRFIAYDRRGYGRTVVPEGGPIGTAADDLDALMTHLKIDRLHLVGTAAGGMVVADYVQSFPNRLRSIVIANSVVGVTDPEYLALGERIRPKNFGELPPDFRELGPAYRAENPEGTRRWLDLEHVSRAPGPRPAAQPYKNKTTFKSLESIRVPTLLITGDADLYTPPHNLRLFAARIPGAATLLIREVGHSSYWEKPDIFNRAVLDFIRKH